MALAQYDNPRVCGGDRGMDWCLAWGALRFGAPFGFDVTSGILKRLHSGWPFGVVGEGGVLGLVLAAVRDLREFRGQVSAAEAVEFETDVLAGFVLARASAGLADATVRGDVGQLEQVRTWFGRPLWEMEPTDADAYFGRVLRGATSGTRLARAQALTTYFAFLELRHKVEIHAMTGRVVQCPIDEVNRPRGRKDARLRIPPSEAEVAQMFSGWASELAGCRKFAPTARNYAAARLMAEVGLRVNEACHLDLADVKWELGRFGKLHVRFGKGSRGSGPRERMVPLVNEAGRTLRWFIEDVWGHFDDDHTRPGAPLFPSERKHPDGAGRRVGDDALRTGLAMATAVHLPGWADRLTPHVLRHFCASQLYLNGVDLIAIQELLGHSWVATTMKYVHVHRTRIEDAWVAGQQRAAARLKGLV
ncbi:tyrosine-type recombinase/integrase [Micromonospora chalcea]